MKQLTPHIFGILTKGSFLNGYLIDNEGSLTLVDAGIPGFKKDVERALTILGKTMADIQRIFITHAHPDHVGDLPAIQAVSNATTYAHRLDAQVMRGESPMGYPEVAELGWFSRFMLKQMKGTSLTVTRVDIEVDDNQVLDEILPGAMVIHLPGHSYGQVGLYLPTDNALIGGDVMMRFPWGLGMPLRPASPDWDAVRVSIQRAATLPVENLMLGHGSPLLGGAQKAMQTFAAKVKTNGRPETK